jgi:hypothetical protein
MVILTYLLICTITQRVRLFFIKFFYVRIMTEVGNLETYIATTVVTEFFLHNSISW